MTTARQDSWSQDEDLLLAEVVLRHIREGSTQLAAFEEIGRKLSRTSAACGFRWNSYVRKQYKSAIEIAKQQRKGKTTNSELLSNDANNGDKENKEKVVLNSEKTIEESPSYSFEGILAFLNQMDKEVKDKSKLQNENQELEITMKEVKEENQELKNELKVYKERCRLIEEDYKALIEIMERARKMVVLEESDPEKQMRFQMDKNGNLERVNK